MSLKKDHQYMYQVQTQLHVGGTDYVDFVIWTKEDIHIERIESDPDLWMEISEKSKHLFQKAILPELVSKLFSRPPVSISAPIPNPGYCYCGQPEEWMI